MKILIVGAGIAGLSLCHRLKDGKHDIDIIEKSSKKSTEGAGICLPVHAMTSFAELGFKEKILAKSHQVTEVRFEKANRKLLNKASLLEAPLNAQPFVAMQRSDLIDILDNGLEDIIHYQRFIDSIVDDKNRSLVTFNDGTSASYDLIVAADGINSDTRHKVFDNPELLDLQVSNWRFCIKSQDHNLQPSYLLGKNEVFMFYPINKDTLYCYGQISDPTSRYFQQDTKAALQEVFSDYDQAVQQAISQADNIIKGRLKSVKSREIYQGNVVLIGDALHGCPPSLQQGVSMALEDVLVLAKCIETGHLIPSLLAQFKAERITRISWVIDESNKTIKLAEIGKSLLGRLIRNTIIRLTGPTNVNGWRKLMTMK